MWVIGIAVCVGLMLAGHAFSNGHHRSAFERSTAREQVATMTAPRCAAPDAAPGCATVVAPPENAAQPQP